MTQYKKFDSLEKALKRQLEALNEQIDRKIVRGLSYTTEARKHKLVLASIMNLRRTQARAGWFGRSLNFSSALIL